MREIKFRVFDLDRNCYATQITTFKFNRDGEINLVVYLDKIQRKGEILDEDKIYCNNFTIEYFTGVKDK